jgi:hypothetical protein
LAQGNYSKAISELFQALRQEEGTGPEPLLLLCLAIAFLGRAMGRRAGDRPASLLYAFAFLEVRPSHRPLQVWTCSEFSLPLRN